MSRVTVEDLRWAAMWLAEGYEGDEEEPTVQTARRVAAWLEAEAARREKRANENAVVRDVMQRSGVGDTPESRRHAREIVRRHVTGVANV